MSRTGRDRQRRQAHELREQGLSVREIGHKLGRGKSTVAEWLLQPVPELRVVPNLHDENGRPVAGAEPGNQRAVKSGAYSEQRVAPLRAWHADRLREDFPWLDDRRLDLAADRFARIQSLAAWLDDQAGLVRNDAGEIFDAADRLEKWSSAAERVLADLYAEDRTRRASAPDVTAYIAGLHDEDDQGDGESAA